MNDNESRKMLYGYLNQKGIYNDENKFNEEMDTEEGRKALWERMNAGGSPVGWEEFNDNLKPTLANAAQNEKQQAQEIAAVQGNNAVNNVSTQNMQVKTQPKKAENAANNNVVTNQPTQYNASNTIPTPENTNGNYTIAPIDVSKFTEDSEKQSEDSEKQNKNTEEPTNITRNSGLQMVGEAAVDASLLSDQRYRNDQEVHDVLFPKMQSAIDSMIAENEQKGKESSDAVAKNFNRQTLLQTQGNAMFHYGQQEAAYRRETDPLLIINSINRMFGISNVQKSDEEKNKWLKDNNVTVVKGAGGKLYYRYNDTGVTRLVSDGHTDTEFMKEVSKMAYKQAGLDFMNKEQVEPSEGTTTQSEPLSEEEIKFIEQRYGRRFGEIVDVLQKDTWNYLKQQYSPEGWGDYVLGEGLKNTLVARLCDTLIDRAAHDSGVRDQLKAEAQADYLESLGDWGGIFTGAAQSVVTLSGDAPIFSIAGIGGNAVGAFVARNVFGRPLMKYMGTAATKAAMRYVSKAVASGWMFGNYDVMTGAVTQLGQDQFDAGELVSDWMGGFATGAVLGVTNAKVDRIANNVANRFGKFGVHAAGYAAEVGLFTGNEYYAEVKNYAQQVYGDNWMQHLDDAASDLGWGKFGKILGRQAAMIGMLKGKGWLENQVRRTEMLKANNMLTAEMMEELEPYKGMLSGKKLNKQALQQVRELRDYGQPIQTDATAEERLAQWEKMMADPNVSAVAKNAATFIMFGERGNINPVTSVDPAQPDENGIMTVVRRDAQGNIISRKKFRDSTTANAELARAQHEARLNNIYITEGEVGDITSRTNAAMLEVAMKNHMSYERIAEIMNGNIQDNWAQNIIADVKATAKRITAEEGIKSIVDIRREIEDKTGVDIEEALTAKMPTVEQINALNEYKNSLDAVKQAQTNKAEAVSEEVKVTEDAQKEVEKKAEELKPYVSPDGKVTKIQIKNKEGEFYVKDYDPDSEFVYYLDENNELQRENWDNVLEYNTIDYQDYMNNMQNGLHEAAKKQAQHEAEQHEEETPVAFQTGQVVNVGAKGEQYRVIGYDDNGNVITESIEVKNNGMTVIRGENPPMSEADLKSMMDENQRLKKEAQDESVKKGVVVEPEEIVKQREEDMKAVKAGSEFSGKIGGRNVTVKVLDVDEKGNCEVEIITEGAEPVHDIVAVGEVRKMMESANADKVPEAPEPPAEPVAPVEPETPEPKKGAYDSIPEEVDEKTGKAKKVYTRATVEETRNALLEKYGQDEDGQDIVSTVANDMIADAEERMNKAKGDPDAKAAAYREKKYWERVRDFDAQENERIAKEAQYEEAKTKVQNLVTDILDGWEEKHVTLREVENAVNAMGEDASNYFNSIVDDVDSMINRLTARDKARAKGKKEKNIGTASDEIRWRDGDEDEYADIKPTGTNRFGNIYTQFKNKAKEAFDFLRKKQEGYLKAVYHRDDLGDIDLLWGDAPNVYNGKGLIHIFRKHVDFLGDFESEDDAVKKIDDIIRTGELHETKDPALVDIIKGNYKVSIAKNNEGNWVLTAFDFITSQKEKLKKRKDAATLGTAGQPTETVDEARAVTSNLSEGKDTNKLDNNQTKIEISAEEDEKYLEAVKNRDMKTAQQMVLDKADSQLDKSLQLESDEGVVGFQYHRGKAPKKTRTMYAVFNVTPEGFKAAYAGNKTGTPVGVWLDAVPLKSYASDLKTNDDGSPSRYVAGDTGANWKDMFSPETYEKMMAEDPTITRGTRWLYERGGKHGTDVPNFSQMNTRQDENGNKVTSPKEGALPANKLIFEIECGMDEDGDLTEYVAENGRFVKKKNQGLDWVGTNKFYFFKTNPNAVGNWGIAGTFRIKRLVPHDEIVSECEKAGVPVQKWVGGYHPENSGLSVETVDEMYRQGKKMKILDAVTYDDEGNVIPLSQRFSDKEDLRFREDTWRTENGFYSPAEKAVIDVKQEKATGEQWIKMIEKAGGLKKEEDKWMGLSDFLKGKKSVTKEEVLRFIRQNSIYIKDINYAEKGNMNDEAAVKEQIFNSSTWEGLMEDLIEYDENDNPYVNREAFKRLQNESNDFYNGFSIDYWSEEIEIDDANAAARYLGLDVDHAINDTRLNYTTDGLQNKREIALVVPSVEPYEGSLPEIHFTDEATGGKTVAWIRFGETTDNEGKRVLVIDEIQSQRHQDGREQGYTSDYDNSARAKFRQATEAMKEFNRKMKEKYGEYHVLEDMTPEEQAEYEKLYKAQTEASQYDAEEEKLYNVPDAPFQKNWQELAMKRMLRYAAENGYDKVAWTDGRTQAQRYGLEKELNSIFVYRAVDPITGEQIPDKYDVSSYDRGDREVMSACGRMDRAKMIKLFGKELGNKLADESDAHEKGWANIEFKDQKFYVGGDGMKGFYDDMLPRWMNKYGKKWGIKVESELMEGLSDHESDYHVKGEDRKWGLNMWTVPVTEEMKSSVMSEGQSMWRGKDNETAKAQSGKATGGWDINNEDENIKHIEEAVTENAKRINVKVNVVSKEDLKNFSEKIQTKLRRGGKGWFNPKTGEIFVYVENANNVGDAVKTVLHEAVGHKGLRELFGADQYDNVMKDLHKQMPAEVQEEINKLAKDKYKGDIAYAMDEYLANKAQEGVTPTWWGKVVGAFRNILKNVFGRDIELTDGDIKYLLWRSYKGLRGEHDMFDLADDVAMRFKNKIGEYAEKIGEIRDDVVFAGNVIKSKNFKNWFGDWEKDPEHASKVVDKDGKPLVVYHGTKSVITTFDKTHSGENLDFGTMGMGFYFTSQKQNADNIARNAQGEGTPTSMPVYLNIRNPKEIKWNQLDGENKKASERLTNKAKLQGYDGFVATAPNGAKWYVAFESTQIKSASEGDKMQNNGGFDPKNPDIRFLAGEGDKSLIGVHNIGISQLKKALKMGGLANPSTAIIDVDKMGHERYGEISLVMPKSLVDSKTGNHGGTHGADIYSPDYPTVYTRFSDKDEMALKDKVYELGGEHVGDMNVWGDFISKLNNGQTGGLEYIYAKQKGADVDSFKHLGFDSFWEPFVTKYQDGLDLRNAMMEDPELMKQINEYFFNKSVDSNFKLAKLKMKPNEGESKLAYWNRLRDMSKKVANTFFDEDGMWAWRLIDAEFDNQKEAYYKNGDFDQWQTRNKVSDFISDNQLHDDYAQWEKDLIAQFNPKEQLYAGTDSRTGEQKYVDNNLKNASMMMKKQGKTNTDGFFKTSMGGVRAEFTPLMKTLKEIRDNKWRLDKEKFEEQREIMEAQYTELANLFHNGDSYDFNTKYYNLIDALKSGNAKKWADKNGFDISEEDGKLIDNFAIALKEMPTEYFELKFERPVGFNEFSGAVVPKSLDAETKKALEDNGLKLFEYDPEVEGDRQRALTEASDEDDVRFRFVGEYGKRDDEEAMKSLELAKQMEKDDWKSPDMEMSMEEKKALGLDKGGEFAKYISDQKKRRIKKATGWERGRDGKWRYETPDFEGKIDFFGDAQVKNEAGYKRYHDLLKKSNGFAFGLNEDLSPEEKSEMNELGKKYVKAVSTWQKTDKLPKFIKDDELFKMYPEFANVELSFKPMADNEKGVLKEPTLDEILEGNAPPFRIVLNDRLKEDEATSVLAHEIQHAIQTREGFAQGGNVESSIPKLKEIKSKIGIPDDKKITISQMKSYLDYIPQSKYNELLDEALNNNYSSVEDWIDSLNPYTYYHNLAGEVEARNVQDRMHMTPEERRNSLASDTEKVSREKQVVDFGWSGTSGLILGEKGAQTLDEFEKSREKKLRWIESMEKALGRHGKEDMKEERERWERRFDDDGEQRMKNLKVAIRMAKKRKSAKDIKMATGWEQGKDNKWRYEIGDAKMNERAKTIITNATDDIDRAVYLPHIIDAPELYEALPTLKDVRVRFYSDENSSYYGMCQGKDIWINLAEYLKTKGRSENLEEADRNGLLEFAMSEIESTFNHEIQHQIQSIEGFADGGNVRDVRKLLKNIIDNKEWDNEEDKRRIEQHGMLVSDAYGIQAAKQLFRNPKRFLKWQKSYEYSGSKEKIIEAGQKWAVEQYWNAMDHIIRDAENWGVDLDKLGFDVDRFYRLLPLSHPDVTAKEGFMIDEAIKVYEAIVKASSKQLTADQNREKINRYEAVEKALKNVYSDYELYKRLAGEVEARAVSKRMGMTAEERRNKPIQSDEDVKRQDQIAVKWYGDQLMGEQSEDDGIRFRDGDEEDKPKKRIGKGSKKERSRRLLEDGAIDWQDYVLMSMGGGAKFKWNDKADGTKGLGGHTTGRDSKLQKKAWRKYIDEKNGEVPEDLAHRIWESMPEEMKEQCTDQEVFNEILDNVRSFDTYEDMLTASEKAHFDKENEDKERAIADEMDRFAQSKGFNTYEEYEAAARDAYAKKQGYDSYDHMMQVRMDMWAQNNGYNDYAQYKEQTEAQERASAEIARQKAEKEKNYQEALIQNRINSERDRVFRTEYLKKQAMDKWLKSKGYENEQDYYAHKRLLAQQSREVERKRAARQRRIEKDLANAGERLPLPVKPANAKMGSDEWYQWIDEIAAVKEHNRNYDKLHPQEAMDRNEAMRQVRDRINESLKSDSVTEMDKRTLNSMLRTLSNADATNIEESLEEANRLVNHLLLKNKRKAVDKLLDLKVQDQNNKGVSVAKNVDDDTRNLFSKLKMTAKDTVSSGLEDKIHDLRSENWHLNEEMKRTDDVSRIAEIENKIEENKQQIVELSEKRRKVLAEKVQTTSESIQKKIDELKEAMQEKEDKMLNNANYEGTIEPDKKDIITLTALEIQKMIADSANTDSDIFKMEASKREFVSAKMALWDEYKERLDEARTRMENAQPNTAEQAETERIYKAMVDEYKAKKHGLELRINGLTNLIVEAQRQQVDNIDKLYEVLDEQYRGGKDALLANVENMQKRRLNFISEAMHVVRGSGKRVNIETVDKEQGKESIVKKAFTAALSSFDYLSQAIATRTGGEDNWIHSHFMYAKDGVQAAWNTLIEGKRLAKNELDSSISGIFANYRGGKTNRKKITDFNSWWKEMDKKPKDGKYGKEHGIYNPNGEYATTGITVMDMNDVDMHGNPTGARYERAEMTKGQAMYAYMVWKMHDGKSKMQLMGFDDRSIMEIEQYIGPENVELSNWIQDEFFANLREKYNAKHKEIYNTSMAAIEHYVPIKILGAARHQDVDLSGDTGNGAGQLVVKTGSIINRTANVLPVDFSYSAAEVIWDHVMQMEEFNAYASVRRDLSWILSCPAFKNQLNTNSAGMFDRFRKAVEVAVKSNKPNGGELDNAVAKLQKPLASSAIAFRNATALKQTLSVPAFFGYSEDPVYWAILTKNIFKGYGRNLPAIAYNMLTLGTQGKKMWKQVEEAKGAYKHALSDDVKWCLKNLPDFWERVSLGVAGDNRLAESFVDATGQFKGKYAEIGMQANKMVDAVTCAIGAKSVYEYEMSKVDKKIREKEKYTFDADADPELVAKWREEQMKEAENLAKMKAVICYNQSQQSNDPAFMSPMQVSRTFTDRCMSLFKNSPISYARKLYEGMQDSYRTINDYNKVKNEYVRQWFKSNNIEIDEATKNDRFEAQKYASNQCRHIIQKGLLNAALGGFILNYLWKEGGEGILGMLDNEDDEEKDAFDYILEYASYPSQGVLGADLPIALLTSGKWTANMMTGGEWEKILGDLKKAYEKYDLFSPEVAYIVTNVGTKFGLGVNLDTWRNIYMGAERMAKSSGEADEMIIAYMYLMNSPTSQRAATAKRLFMEKYGDDEYINHIDEYIDQVERAIGYTMDADVWESWLPAPKSLSAAAESKLYREFITKNLTPEEQQQAKDIKEFNDKMKKVDRLDVLMNMLEKEDNVYFKEKIVNRIHSLNKEEHDSGKTKAEEMRDKIIGKTQSSKSKGEQIWISYMNGNDALTESNIKRRNEEEKQYYDTFTDLKKAYAETQKAAEEKYKNLSSDERYNKVQSDADVVKARNDVEEYYKSNEGTIRAYTERRELLKTINSMKKMLEGIPEDEQKKLVKGIRLKLDQAVRK